MQAQAGLRQTQKQSQSRRSETQTQAQARLSQIQADQQAQQVQDEEYLKFMDEKFAADEIDYEDQVSNLRERAAMADSGQSGGEAKVKVKVKARAKAKAKAKVQSKAKAKVKSRSETVAQLLIKAGARHIVGRSKMNKSQLQTALRGAE